MILQNRVNVGSLNKAAGDLIAIVTGEAGAAGPMAGGMAVLRGGALVAALLAMGVGACSPRSDFDRPTMSAFNPTVPRNAGSYADAGEPGSVSNFKLTTDERRMRRKGYRLLPPLGEGRRHAEFVAARRYANRAPANRPMSSGPVYYEWLKDGPWQTDYAMWAKLIDDMRADEATVIRFAGAVRRVLRTDYHRHRIFQREGALDEVEAINLTARLEENKRFANMVADALEDRIAVYAYTIDRAELEVPSDRINEAARTLADLTVQQRELDAVISADYSRAPQVASARQDPLTVIPAPIIDYSLNR